MARITAYVHERDMHAIPAKTFMALGISSTRWAKGKSHAGRTSRSCTSFLLSAEITCKNIILAEADNIISFSTFNHYQLQSKSPYSIKSETQDGVACLSFNKSLYFRFVHLQEWIYSVRIIVVKAYLCGYQHNEQIQ